MSTLSSPRQAVNTPVESEGKELEETPWSAQGAGSGFTRSVVVSRVLLKRETTTDAQYAKDKPVIEG